MINILNQVGIENYIFLSVILFCIGVFGVLYRRNAIIVFMSIEIMLNAVNLLFVAFSTYHQDAQGQVFVFFSMAVAAVLCRTTCGQQGYHRQPAPDGI